MKSRLLPVLLAMGLPGAGAGPAPVAAPLVPAERLGRGVVALARPAGKVFISWRLLAAEPPGAMFNVFR